MLDLSASAATIAMPEADASEAMLPYVPEQIRKAYDIECSNEGYGQTIAIVVAYGSPNLENDIDVFNQRYNLPPTELEIVYPQGPPTETDTTWQLETTLDVQWSHVIAPKAKIMLLVAKDESIENLFHAVQYAIYMGAGVVSMSWGFSEWPEQKAYDEIFKKAEGVVFIAASGDMVKPVYPAASPYVLGIGGTSMQLNPCGGRSVAETAWYESGGGISQYEMKPYWQFIKSSAKPLTDMRTVPDVAFFADPFPGVSVYVTITEEGGTGQWRSLGGTSVGSPCWAGIFALAIPPGKRLLEPQAMLYEIAGGCQYTNAWHAYKDVTNGNTPSYPALRGYDYTTGLGTPSVHNLVHAIRCHCKWF